MRIHELLHACLDGVEHLVDVTDERIDLRGELRLPESVRYTRSGLDDAAKLDLGSGALLLCALGPTPPAHSDPEALAPVLREMRPGARAVLVIGWRIEELPYHRLLGPLVDGRCQILEAAPVERVSVPSAQSALVVECVERLAAPRSYLTDVHTSTHHEAEPDTEAMDPLRTVLRMANEYVLVDLVSRPLRRRLIELDRLLSEKEARLRTAERELARSERRVAALESSASFQIGQAVVKGVRRPTHAVLNVPRDLTRVWQFHRAKRRSGSAAPHGHVPTEAREP